MTGTSAATKLHRTAFQTSRLLDFCSQKELIAQVGHQPAEWPPAVIDSALNGAGVAAERLGEAKRLGRLPVVAARPAVSPAALRKLRGYHGIGGPVLRIIDIEARAA
jgi:hypothetical protein